MELGVVLFTLIPNNQLEKFMHLVLETFHFAHLEVLPHMEKTLSSGGAS